MEKGEELFAQDRDKIMDFSLTLLKKCVTGTGKNVLLSPISVMTANGAVGDTRQEIEDKLQISVPVPQRGPMLVPGRSAHDRGKYRAYGRVPLAG